MKKDEPYAFRSATRRRGGLQRAKYSTFGVPVLYVCHLNEIPEAVYRITQIIRQFKAK